MKRYKKIAQEILLEYKGDITSKFIEYANKIIKKYGGINTIDEEGIYVEYPEGIELQIHEDGITFGGYFSHSESQFLNLLKRLNWLNEEVENVY